MATATKKQQITSNPCPSKTKASNGYPLLYRNWSDDRALCPSRSYGYYSPNPFPKMKSPERNQPCPCGSGHKYKKCCLLTEQAVRAKYEKDIDADLQADFALGQRLLQEYETIKTGVTNEVCLAMG